MPKDNTTFDGSTSTDRAVCAPSIEICQATLTLHDVVEFVWGHPDHLNVEAVIALINDQALRH